MDTETREEAIRQLQQINQGGEPVEDYNVRFKSIAAITGFNDTALVAMYRAGLNHKLGYEVVKAGAPQNCKEPRRQDGKGKGQAYTRELTVEGLMMDMGDKMKEKMAQQLKVEGFGDSQ